MPAEHLAAMVSLWSRNDNPTSPYGTLSSISVMVVEPLADPRPYVLVGGEYPLSEPVITVVAHQVADGYEADFYAWATAMLRDTARSRDYLGGGVLGPSRRGGDWHIVCRWSDDDAARRWEGSGTRARWLAAAKGFTRQTMVRHEPLARPRAPHPPSPPGRAARPRTGAPGAAPPKWKMAVVTLTAVMPPVLLFNVTVLPYLRDFSVLLRTLALCVGVTVVVTWVTMPQLIRLFSGWLRPSSPPRHIGRHRGTPDPRPAAPRPGGGRPVLRVVREEGAPPYRPVGKGSTRQPTHQILREHG